MEETNKIKQSVLPAAKICNTVLIGNLKNQVLSKYKIKINLPSCNVCGEYYSKVELLQKHMIDHALNKKSENSSFMPIKKEPNSPTNTFEGTTTYETSSPDIYKPSIQKQNKYSAKKCQVCGKQFLHNQNFKRHLQTHQPDEQRTKFKCQFCGNVYSFKDNLTRHIRKSHPTSNREISKPLKQKENHPSAKKCPVCSKQFLHAQNLNLHLETHKAYKQPKNKFACNFCDGIFANSSNLNRHIRGQHPTSNFEMHKLLKITKSSATAKKCRVCGKQFLHAETLKRHLETHKISHQPKIFACKYCDSVFTQSHNRDRHVRNQHSKSIVQNNESAEKSLHAQNLKRNKKEAKSSKNTSEEPKKFETSNSKICKSFKQEENRNLKPHLYTHKTYEQPKKFPCKFCNYVFSNGSSLNRHVRNQHSKINVQSVKPTEKRKAFRCQHCSATFKLQATLNSHIKAKHSKVKKPKLVCRNKTRPLKRRLNSNKSSSKRGQFQCPDCKKFFTFEGNLKMHIRVQHPTSDQPVTECEVCGKQFWYVHNLKQHMETHKPPEQRAKFQCPHCDKLCTYKGNLKTHIRLCH